MNPQRSDDGPGMASASHHDEPLACAAVEWIDATGLAWTVEIRNASISLTHLDETLIFHANSWKNDIYVATHGAGHIVRFSSFEKDLGFILTASQAEPVLTHMGMADRNIAEETPDQSADEDQRALLWPKVSPLAVWALFSSALVFLPIVGLLAAVSTVVLLLLHRAKVRPARAWHHSRLICVASCVFLTLGLLVSLLCTNWLMKNLAVPRPSLQVSSAAFSPVKPGTGADGDHVIRASSAGADEDRNWGLIAAALVVVLLSLSVHECAHAISAWWLGDDFARRLGRVTVNPMAHIDPVGTILMPLVLLWMNQGVFGWARPVPVRMENVPRPRRAHILVSIAGPGSNLLLASASMIFLLGATFVIAAAAPSATLSHLSPWEFATPVSAAGFTAAPTVAAILTILKLGFAVNILLAAFNMIPIPPLDGSWVLEHLFPRTLGPLYAKIRPFGFMLFLLLIYSNTIPYLLAPGFIALEIGEILIQACTPF